MKKTLIAVAAAATIAVAAVATPTTAEARWGWWGPALGAFAVGAIVGGALASPITAGIMAADITRRTRTIRRTVTAIPRTATATRQPIPATPMRRGPITAACAGGTATVIACAERLRLLLADRQADVGVPCGGAGLFSAPNGC